MYCLGHEINVSFMQMSTTEDDVILYYKRHLLLYQCSYVVQFRY